MCIVYLFFKEWMNSPQKPHCAYLATKSCLKAPENLISSEERYIEKVTQIYLFIFLAESSGNIFLKSSWNYFTNVKK